MAFGLARRRNDKRTEDCVSAAFGKPCGRSLATSRRACSTPRFQRTDDGKLPPFHPSQLYEVIRILQPSQEVILGVDAQPRAVDLVDDRLQRHEHAGRGAQL